MGDPGAKDSDKRNVVGEGAGATGETGVAGENARLRDEIASLQRKADENWDLFLRSRADLDNFRKRTERDIAMMVRMGKRDLFLRLLEVADNFGRALAAPATDVEALRSGLDMLSRQLDAVLDAEGVKPIPAVGEKFNPALHEAVATWVSQDVKDDTVTDEIQRGYTYQGDVLRVARVRVAQPAGQTVGGAQPSADAQPTAGAPPVTGAQPPGGDDKPTGDKAE